MTETIATLEDVLAAREQRVKRQCEALVQWKQPLISVTLVMPGPQKNSELARSIFKEAVSEINSLCNSKGWPVTSFQDISPITGPETLYVVDTDARALKQALAEQEEAHQLGRLWDLDVIDRDGTAISRSELGMEQRKCLVCNKPGHACARSAAHPLPEIMRAIEEKVKAFLNR